MAGERDDQVNSAVEFRRKRRGRNLALLVVLGALVVLFYAITIIKMGAGH